MALILGLISDISGFIILIIAGRMAYKFCKRYFNSLNKPQNGKVTDAESAEKLALLILISDKEDEVRSFIAENIHLLSTETVSKLVEHLEQLKVLSYSPEETNLKLRFDRLEEQLTDVLEDPNDIRVTRKG
jgi:hypothetical protein